MKLRFYQGLGCFEFSFTFDFVFRYCLSEKMGNIILI